jgi:hypothetical protein
LGLAGLAHLWQSQRQRALLTLVSVLLYTAFAAGYDTTDSYVYLIPAFLFFALWMGVGAAAGLAALRARRAAWAALAGAAGLAAILAAAGLNWSALDLSRDRAAAEWGQAALEQAPRGGLLITARDQETFSLWYLQYVAGVRPDVAIVDRDLLHYDWYRTALRGRYPRLAIAGESVAALVASNPGQPAVYLAEEAVTP